jgi:hypothetical protein
VSAGVRIFPNIALTSVPGASYSGASVATTFAQLTTLSTNDFLALPTSHQGIGVQGATATGRPVDPESFVFQFPVCDASGWTATANNTHSLPFSVPYVVFVGLPASTVCYVECVLNIEATQVIAHSSATILADSAGLSETVGDSWPVPEALHRVMAPYLPHPGRPSEAAAASDAGFLASMWSGLKSGVGRIAGQSAALLLPGAARTAAQALSGGSRGISGQRYGRQFAGYLQ